MNFLFMIPGAFFAPVIHEFVKARVSAALGDGTPKKSGFITFNPFKFFEPIGFFMMLYFGVGWGQPVPTSPFGYKDKRKGIALTYTAPMVASLLVGILTLTVLSFLRTPLLEWSAGFGPFAVVAMGSSLSDMHLRGSVLNMTAVIQHTPMASGMYYAVLVLNQIAMRFATANIALALFNLIPVFPMAMNKLLHIMISPSASMKLNHYEKPLQIAMFLLLIFGLLQMLIFPLVGLIVRTVTF